MRRERGPRSATEIHDQNHPGESRCRGGFFRCAFTCPHIVDNGCGEKFAIGPDFTSQVSARRSIRWTPFRRWHQYCNNTRGNMANWWARQQQTYEAARDNMCLPTLLSRSDCLRRLCRGFAGLRLDVGYSSVARLHDIVAVASSSLRPRMHVRECIVCRCRLAP